MGESPEKPLTVAEVRAIAYRYLARREYACRELSDKLSRRGLPPGIVSQAVEEMEREGLVSDLRFTESFTRSRISRLYGPLKIRAELMKRGIASSMINQVLAQHEEVWQESAQQWVMKRAGQHLDQKEKARLYRSGTSRGFSHEHIMRAIDKFRRSEFP
jgi:regulatory protein